MNHDSIETGPIYNIYPEDINTPIKGEEALWRAVINQTIMDARSNSSKKQNRYEKAQSIAWLLGSSTDFLTVCSLANMDPEYIKERAREAIKSGKSIHPKPQPSRMPLHVSRYSLPQSNSPCNVLSIIPATQTTRTA